MVKSVTEVQGPGDIAFVWGRSELEFVFAETTYRNGGDSLSVLRKGGDGRWRIARRIWNDPIADPD
jgi:ketosteroid isomerase-like protein